jgi:hypothetical protein
MPQPPPLRPNTKKIFSLNLIKLTIGLFGLIAALLFFESFVGLDVFTMVLEQFGMELETSELIFYIIAISSLGYVSLLTLNFIHLNSIRYEFFPDKIASHTVALFIMLDSKEVPYKNITRVSFETNGFIEGLLNTGNVVLDLSALKEKTMKIECVDNPQQVAEYIQKMINYYNTRAYARRIEDYNVGNILDKGDV